MDRERRKKLLEDYKNRKPEMGILCLHCTETGDKFLGISNDTKAGLSGNRAKLSFGGHPNKQIQALWDQYGEECFVFSVYEPLDYDDPTKDQTAKLEKLLEDCLSREDRAQKIWR